MVKRMLSQPLMRSILKLGWRSGHPLLWNRQHHAFKRPPNADLQRVGDIAATFGRVEGIREAGIITTVVVSVTVRAENHATLGESLNGEATVTTCTCGDPLRQFRPDFDGCDNDCSGGVRRRVISHSSLHTAGFVRVHGLEMHR